MSNPSLCLCSVLQRYIVFIVLNTECLCHLGGKAISEDGPASRVLLRKEVLRLIINLSSSVGTKGHETGLLTYASYSTCIF